MITLPIAGVSALLATVALAMPAGGREVCSGQLSLRNAQNLVAGGWVEAYHARFG